MAKNKTKTVSINKYLSVVRETDRLPEYDLAPVLQGLFGEVGGMLAALKKKRREPKSTESLDDVINEELGDAFWYFTCLCNRLKLNTRQIYIKAARDNAKDKRTRSLINNGQVSINRMCGRDITGDLHTELAKLGQLTGNFLNIENLKDSSNEKAKEFLDSFFTVVNILNLDFGVIINDNIRKVSSRFTRPPNSKLPNFDKKYPKFERLPDYFEIEFVDRARNQQAMRWNGVFIGNPLTDNIAKSDGYRFHDVFHFSYAAILHWSPTFRALIKHKRKSKTDVDRDQDGGRAIVVEEGLSAWIFNIAKKNHFFSGHKSLSFDMLKNISNIISGFEVEECPLILWEEAIIKGYDVFREVKKNKGGVVIGDRKAREIYYLPKLPKSRK